MDLILHLCLTSGSERETQIGALKHRLDSFMERGEVQEVQEVQEIQEVQGVDEVQGVQEVQEVQQVHDVEGGGPRDTAWELLQNTSVVGQAEIERYSAGRDEEVKESRIEISTDAKHVEVINLENEEMASASGVIEEITNMETGTTPTNKYTNDLPDDSNINEIEETELASSVNNDKEKEVANSIDKESNIEPEENIDTNDPDLEDFDLDLEEEEYEEELEMHGSAVMPIIVYVKPDPDVETKVARLGEPATTALMPYRYHRINIRGTSPPAPPPAPAPVRAPAPAPVPALAPDSGPSPVLAKNCRVMINKVHLQKRPDGRVKVWRVRTRSSVRKEQEARSRRKGSSFRKEQEASSTRTGSSFQKEQAAGRKRTGYSFRKEKEVRSKRTGSSFRKEQEARSTRTGSTFRREQEAGRKRTRSSERLKDEPRRKVFRRSAL